MQQTVRKNEELRKKSDDYVRELAKDVDIRTSEEGFMKCLRTYYEQLAPRFIPYLSTNGGNVIMMQVENEYGSYGNDKEYLLEVE